MPQGKKSARMYPIKQDWAKDRERYGMLQDIVEISDGKVYGTNDMVKAACNDCAGCHSCCEGMGDTILLDPYDVYRLTMGLGKSFEQLLAAEIELHVEAGVIVPNLKMDAGKNQCFFLNDEGRCRIHTLRPGLCRVFPLGRIYEENGISYFLQKEACKKENRTKVKVSKWLDMPELKKYHQFLKDWHEVKKCAEQYIGSMAEENGAKTVNLFLLNLFFTTAYDGERDFYEQFYWRMEQVKRVLPMEQHI